MAAGLAQSHALTGKAAPASDKKIRMGIVAHQSSLKGGEQLKVPSFDKKS